MRFMTRAAALIGLLAIANVGVLNAQNPLSDWVKKNKRQYRVRQSPNSFDLLGYVYVNNRLEPPPLERRDRCLTAALQNMIKSKDPSIVANAEDKVFNSSVSASNIDAFLHITGKQLTPMQKAELTASFKRNHVRGVQLKTGHVSEYILTSGDLMQMAKNCADQMRNDHNAVVVAQALSIDGAEYVFVDERGNEITVKGKLDTLLTQVGLGSSGTTVQTAQYTKPIFFGYVPAKYCEKTKSFRQKC